MFPAASIPTAAPRWGSFTPAPVARLMASMFENRAAALDLLDAGAGVGSLTAAWIAGVCEMQSKPKPVPEFASKMVGTLEVTYDTENRRAVRLRGVRGYRIPFDAQGRMDQARMRREYPWMALTTDSDGFLGGRPRREMVISVTDKIVARRIRWDILFSSTTDQIKAVKEALGLGRRPTSPEPTLRLVKGK